jgi:hypothetical protein
MLKDTWIVIKFLSLLIAAIVQAALLLRGDWTWWNTMLFSGLCLGLWWNRKDLWDVIRRV